MGPSNPFWNGRPSRTSPPCCRKNVAFRSSEESICHFKQANKANRNCSRKRNTYFKTGHRGLSTNCPGRKPLHGHGRKIGNGCAAARPPSNGGRHASLSHKAIR